MPKKVFFGADARRRVEGGFNIVYKAVKVSYGRKGGDAVIDSEWDEPDITHDGVTIAESIDLPNVDDETLGYRAGANLLKAAARNLNKSAGDGTTSVTILTYHTLKDANQQINAGHNAQLIKRGIQSAAADVIAALPEMAEQIDEKSPKVRQIATISAGDELIGGVIADVVKKVGKDGIINVEVSQTLLTVDSEIVEGYVTTSGWISPYFITDIARRETVFDNPAIILTDKKITLTDEIKPIIDLCLASGRKFIVLIADDVRDQALEELIYNRVHNGINVIVAKAPSFGDRRIETFKDIAVLTGGTLIGDTTQTDLKTADIKLVGTARRVVVGQDDITIIEGGGKKSEINKRIALLKAQPTSSEHERSLVDDRAAAMSGKVGIIKVGGATQTEVDEKKYRVDDAVAAVKAALSEGIVAGGGVTMVRLSELIEDEDFDFSTSTTKSREEIRKRLAERNGRQIFKRALQQPFLQIMKNAGINGDALLAQVKATGKGIDILDPTEKLIDLKKAGVIDPVRVTKEVIKNAASIASTVATMGVLVVNIPDKTHE